MKTMTIQLPKGRTIVVQAPKENGMIYHLVLQIKRPMNIERLAAASDGFITESTSGNQWSWSNFPGCREEYGVLMAQHYAQIPDVVNTATVLPSLEWMRPFIPTNTAILAAKA